MTDIETITELREQLKLATSWRLRAQAEVKELRDAVRALGVIGNGYCFCSEYRDPDKADHEPECQDLLAALAKVKP